MQSDFIIKCILKCKLNLLSDKIYRIHNQLLVNDVHLLLNYFSFYFALILMSHYHIVFIRTLGCEFTGVDFSLC